MPDTKNRPKTGPHLAAAPQPSPSPEETPAVPQEDLAAIVGEVLRKRGVPQVVASELSHDLVTVIAKSAAKVPAWVLYALITFGLPALMTFYGTYQAITALPPRVDSLEAKQEEQGKQLDRIEALLQGPSSRPRY